ncbi:MAG: folate-binding protein YgfZ [Hyphomonadaceae bacterium]
MSAFVLDRRILRVSGPDALGFLDNLLTNDLTRLEREPVLYAGLLTPQGKVAADMFVWLARDGAFLIETPNPELLAKLTLYKLRANVVIEDVSEAIDIVLDADGQAHGHVAAPDPRLPALGVRSLAPKASLKGSDLAILLAHRIALGVPDLWEDAEANEVFALEALFEELNGVDFQKGCFVGQENVSRMKRRATTRKKFCRLAIEGEAKKGEPVTAGGVELGTIRAASPGEALALIRLDRALEAMAEEAPLTAGALPARLDPPPWLILPSRETEETT